MNAGVKITEAQRKAYKDVFDQFDADGSGSIDGAEVKIVMQRLGQHPTDEEVEAIVRQYDTDKSGVIEFDEFCNMMEKQVSNASGEELLAEAFRWFDSDGSGSIDADKLKARLKLPDVGLNLTADQIDEMISGADVDGDGVVNMDDFRALVGEIGI